MGTASWRERATGARDRGEPLPALPAGAVDPRLYAYQKTAVRWLREVGSGLLGDEQGLGKSACAAGALDAPAIVVCPAALREHWRRELATWRPELRVTTDTVESVTLEADVTIVSYEGLVSVAEALAKRRWSTLVVDECQNIKSLKIRKRKGNRGAQRALAVAAVAAASHRKILLSGTPILNRPIELFSMLKLIDPVEWADEFEFSRRYADAHQKKIGWDRKKRKPILRWDFSGSSNEAELHTRLDGIYVLRRTKDEVAPDLPSKSRHTRLVTLANAAEYYRAERDFLGWVAKKGGFEAALRAAEAEALTRMTALRHLAALGKTDEAIDWIAEHHESTGRPLVVMAHHSDVLDRLYAGAFDMGLCVGEVRGAQDPKARQDAIDQFQDGQIDVLVCSIATAGVGLTLTRASEMLVVERTLRYADMVQAEDRLHRIGTTRPVTITYLDAEGTIDEHVAALVFGKAEVAASILDGEEAAQALVRSLAGRGA